MDKLADDLLDRQVANEVAIQTDKVWVATEKALLVSLRDAGFPLPAIEQISSVLYQSALYCYAKGAFDIKREIERVVVAGLPQ